MGGIRGITHGLARCGEKRRQEYDAAVDVVGLQMGFDAGTEYAARFDFFLLSEFSFGRSF